MKKDEKIENNAQKKQQPKKQKITLILIIYQNIQNFQNCIFLLYEDGMFSFCPTRSRMFHLAKTILNCHMTKIITIENNAKKKQQPKKQKITLIMIIHQNIQNFQNCIFWL